MEELSKITKTRGADKSKTIQKNGVEMKPQSMKIRLQNSTKKMLKNRAQKTEKITKTDPKMAPEK